MSKPTFYVGLCMAGAVSAGAYTAGVVDYLIEALDNWEKNRGKDGIPDHLVSIPVIGGASAGGMTGILTASAINNVIPHVSTMGQSNAIENKFWHTWVDLLKDDMFPELLKTNDIKEGKILSLFNSSFIDKIAARFVNVDAAHWIERPYFKDLKIFTTLTSLKGLSFNIGLLGSGENRDQYCVSRHNDYACFKLNDNTYSNDGWIPLDFRVPETVKLAGDAAMATGAFPVGLRSREVNRKSKYINDNPFLKKVTELNPVEGEEHESLNVDGGVINNEPFDRVRDVLKELTGQHESNDYNSYNKFTSTQIMIDPFPSEPPEYKHSDRLFQVVGSTLTALINQSRIKQENLVAAADSDCAGQYLIAPSRDVPQLKGGGEKAEMGAKAIACGAFGGFSGFLNKEFRIHDYFLGRANCEKFLRDHFTVPADTTNLITEGYKNLTEAQKEAYYSKTNKIKKHLPIIPVIAPRKDKKYMPVFSSGSDWPVIRDKDIERFRPDMKDRVNDLIMNLADYNRMTWLLLRIGGFIVLNRKIAGVAMDMIKKSLVEHQLIKK